MRTSEWKKRSQRLRGSQKTEKPPAASLLSLNLGDSGFTLLELIIVLALLATLTFGAIPIAHNLIKREREIQLQRTLRELRDAIDAYHLTCEAPPGISFLDKKVGDACYPPKLETLVEGVHLMAIPPQPGVVTTLKPDALKRFLRRIPKDPITGNTDWGLRSVQDDPDATSWGGQNVYDVYSKARGIPIDGKSKYSDW